MIEALDELMRVLLHQLAVLERAGLGLVGVADDVLLHVALGQERGLQAHGEAGAAAAAQARALEASRSAPSGSRLQRRAQRRVAAARARRRRSSRGRARRSRGRAGCRSCGGSAGVGIDARAARDLLARAAGPRRGGSGRAAPARRRSSSGPTYVPLTDAIGAMSQAPRHSNERMLTSGSSPRVLGERGVAARARRRASRRCSCRRRRPCARRGAGGTCRRRADADEVGRRLAQHAGGLHDALRRAPAVAALHGLQRRRSSPPASPGTRHLGLDLRAQVGGDLGRRGVRDDGTGPSSRSAASSQPGMREPPA